MAGWCTWRHPACSPPAGGPPAGGAALRTSGPRFRPRRVFRAAKVVRAQHVGARSFMIDMHGTIRIICFTGLPIARGRSKLLSAGGVVLESVPHIGTFVQVADIGVNRAYGALHSENAVAAAAAWRSVLTGTVRPETLPLWAESERHSSHAHRRQRPRETSSVERSPEE